MTSPKVGDRVRVVVEGVVDAVHGGSEWFDVGGITIKPRHGYVVSVEVLAPPEPDWKPGDVVKDAVGSVFTREATYPRSLPWRLVGGQPGADPWFRHEGPTRPLTILHRAA